MSILLTILAIIVIFSVLVLIHEFGHFWMARRAGIKVLEFGFGFPPRLFKIKRGETVYSLNLIPFGGFVKLYGEDTSDPKALTAKNSFISKTPWTRVKVIVAGVVMNFLLAIFLLTFGFTFGIEPLIAKPEDLFQAIREGTVKTAPGVYVKDVQKNSHAEKAGVRKGDQILTVNGIEASRMTSLLERGDGEEKWEMDLQILRDGQRISLSIPFFPKDLKTGITLTPGTLFSRLFIHEVSLGSNSERAGLRANDIILRMNGRDIYSLQDFQGVLGTPQDITYEVSRGETSQAFRVLLSDVRLSDVRNVVISEVLPKSAAESQGFQGGDVILQIDGRDMGSPEDVQKILRDNPGKEMEYRLMRRGSEVRIRAKTGTDNTLGIGLSELISFFNKDAKQNFILFRGKELSLYSGTVFTSLVLIKDVKYPFPQSLWYGVKETFRLTGLTIEAFGRTIRNLVSRFEVPKEIGGPVQIAYYTHAFVQEGFFALIRFTALLSLSLAVLNVLPIPALDGGRLLFVVAEVVFRRRINARFETLVHSIGFILLLILILLVTYSDIAKLI